MQGRRLLEQRLDLLPQPQLGDLVGIELAQVRGEHLAIAFAKRRIQHPAGLAGQALGRPLVPVGEEVDDRLEQLGRYLADRAELIDRAERNRARADELLRPFGELEQLDPGGDARPRPAERLRGAVLGQPAIGEHRAYGLGLLVWVELLTGDVLDRPVGVLGVDVADLGVDVGLAELLVCGDSVIARNELVVVAGGPHDHRHDQPTQLDRGRERVHVVGVEFADVVTDRDAVQRDPLPAAIHECGHLNLLWLVAPPGAGPIPDLHARLRATLGRVDSVPGGIAACSPYRPPPPRLALTSAS